MININIRASFWLLSRYCPWMRLIAGRSPATEGIARSLVLLYDTRRNGMECHLIN